ncbi:S8/S53 family peptidase [Fulvivirga lutea]|uniref:S8 family peptidase n=1 Tax=Fulvivirga lutea TaxID=2810512 RepID=A0A974WHW2_9BACT|nr:S8/S53 family peptidase [Fulvivirga lutea]QSE96395.1 S8 family peptidase [Fulvivirga lutea]
MVRISLVIYFLLTALILKAQNRYVVFFTDKDNSPYSISQPQEFLSAKAIDRRVKQNIAITEQDLPVNQTYVDQVKNLGAEVYFKSKWFNAVLVQTTSDVILDIENLSFVSNAELVANNSRLKEGSRISFTEDGEGVEAVANGFQNSLLGVDILHEDGLYGEGITIAFMDSGFTGVNTQSAFNGMLIDMELNLVENDNNIYQYQDHGTRVLSTVAAQIADEYQGVAPNANFLLFVTEDLPTEYRIEEYNFLFAAEMADSAGVDIINTSLGYNNFFTVSSMDYTYEEMDGATTVITRASELAFERGILVVTSVGNEGRNGDWPYLTAPADGPNVLSVGSIREDGSKSDFSSIGPNANGQTKPEVMALGSGATVVNSSGNVVGASGTSFSSPQIAGYAALLWQQYPDLTNKELFDLILSSANRFQSPDNEYGYGVPSYKKLITSVDEGLERLSIFPNPFNENVTISTNEHIQMIFVYDQMGRLIMSNKFNSLDTEASIDTSEWHSGLYIFNIVLSNNQQEKLKLLKVR